MKYYLYEVDLDIMDSIKEVFLKDNKNEDVLLKVKTNGSCLLEYTDEQYVELLDEVGKYKNVVESGFIYFDKLKKIYDSVKLQDNHSDIRNFKLKVYKAITNCHGIIILEGETLNSSNSSKWWEFWKK